MPLPGYEHVQRGYLTSRDGESVLVPIEQLSYEEIMHKAEEYKAISSGTYAHAMELEKYAREHFDVRTVAVAKPVGDVVRAAPAVAKGTARHA